MIDELKSFTVLNMEQELKSILCFWSNNTIDAINGGFIAELDGEGKQTMSSEKSAVLNTRLLWTYSAAYNFYKDPNYLTLADRAYSYLVRYFWDEKNGGLFWSVYNDGKLNNNRKQAYAQAFGLYGFSEYYKASGKKESLRYAQQLFELIETNFKDPINGGYIEALSDRWLPLNDMRLSEKDDNEPKSMNTHLHIIEAYTNLYRVSPNKQLKKSIKEIIQIFRHHIIDERTNHLKLFFDLKWTVKSNVVSYGHDIEGAWLLSEAAHSINDEELIKSMKGSLLKMVDATMDEGFDKDGSVFYELEGDHLDKDKHWWPQAEALVGLLDAYQNSSDTKYLVAATKVWQFIINHIKDGKNGEWFWKVDEDGKPDLSLPKVGFWKCPYHNSRALMEAITRIRLIGELEPLLNGKRITAE